MSEPMPEEGAPAQPSFFQRKFMGIPAIVWLLGAAILAYLYFRNKGGSSSSGGASSSGGTGDTSQTGDVTLTPGTEQIDVTAPSTQDTTSQETTTTSANTTPPVTSTPNPQPTPTPKPPTKVNQGNFKTHTVQKGETLASVAKQFGIDVACLAHNNVYVKGEAQPSKVGQPLGTGAGLKTGQVLRVPTNTDCVQQGYKS